jgi:hypothetical protein
MVTMSLQLSPAKTILNSSQNFVPPKSYTDVNYLL